MSIWPPAEWGTIPAPTPSLAPVAAHITSNVNLPATSTTTYLTTAELQPGLWLLIVVTYVAAGSTASNPIDLALQLGTALGSIDGGFGGLNQSAASGFGFGESVTLAALVTITQAGTLQAVAENNDSAVAGTIHAAAGALSSGATGYVAIPFPIS